MTTTTDNAPPAVETAWVCDECAGDGQLAYDLEAAMWVPRSATADWPADDCIGISVLDCLQCDGTGTVRLDPGRANRPTRTNTIGFRTFSHPAAPPGPAPPTRARTTIWPPSRRTHQV